MENHRSYTLNELAEMYNVSPRTMNNWLKPIKKELLAMDAGNRIRLRILLPKQVKKIMEFLG